MSHPHWLPISFIAVLATGAVAVPRQMPALIWNATVSTPIGLYVLHPISDLRAFDMSASLLRDSLEYPESRMNSQGEAGVWQR